MHFLKKLGFIGLDNAGKTSIITAITRRFGFEEEVAKLMPTRRIARDTFKFLGVEVSRADFGGQAQYRQAYLKNPGKFLAGTDLIFYVIDVQDHERYDQTLNYIDQILIYYKEVRENPCISIFFHKFDPQISMDKDLNRRILALKQALTRTENLSRFFILVCFC